jgi:hypothetical protein
VGVLDLIGRALTLYRRNVGLLLVTAAVIFLPLQVLQAIGRATVSGPRSSDALIGFLGFGLALPMVQTALALAASDRLLGGSATWKEVWGLVAGRLPAVLSAIVPAGLLVAAGFFLFLVPGVVLAFFFSFVPFVAALERRGGPGAIGRSVALVRSDWLRLLLLLLVLGFILLLTKVLGSMFLPTTPLGAQLLADVLTLLLLPIPAVAELLLYLDLRHRREGYDLDRLRADVRGPGTAASPG